MVIGSKVHKFVHAATVSKKVRQRWTSTSTSSTLITCSHAPSVANCTHHTTPDISIRSNIQHLLSFAESVPRDFISKQNWPRHMNVHSDIKPFRCDLRQKWFTQNKSLTRHMKVHEDSTVTCSMCNKTCSTPEQLYTHYRGAHGKGYDTPCGEHYQWPARRACHQKDCTKCKNYRELKKIKKRFPMPFKKENQDSVAVKQELRNEWLFMNCALFVLYCEPWSSSHSETFSNMLCNKCFQCLCTVLKLKSIDGLYFVICIL